MNSFNEIFQGINDEYFNLVGRCQDEDLDGIRKACSDLCSKVVELQLWADEINEFLSGRNLKPKIANSKPR